MAPHKNAQTKCLECLLGLTSASSDKIHFLFSGLISHLGSFWNNASLWGTWRRLDFMKGDFSELILLMIMEIPELMLMVRRMHDLNRSGFE